MALTNGIISPWPPAYVAICWLTRSINSFWSYLISLSSHVGHSWSHWSTTTMYRIIAVGRTCSVPWTNWIRFGMCGQGVMTSWVHIQCHQVVLVVQLGSQYSFHIVWQKDNEIRHWTNRIRLGHVLLSSCYSVPTSHWPVELDYTEDGRSCLLIRFRSDHPMPSSGAGGGTGRS